MEFREMRRFKQALTREECAAILREEKRGTLAVIGDGGWPYALPINFWYDEEADKLYFHCGRAGHKHDAIRACEKVCFTVRDAGQSAGDWSYFVNSVIVFGCARFVEDPALKLEKARAYGAKYIPTQEELERELRGIDRMELVEITVKHMTGKRVHEKQELIYGRKHVMAITQTSYHRRLHHKIYLNDARNTAPGKLKTAIRHPIRKVPEGI